MNIRRFTSVSYSFRLLLGGVYAAILSAGLLKAETPLPSNPAQTNPPAVLTWKQLIDGSARILVVHIAPVDNKVPVTRISCKIIRDLKAETSGVTSSSGTVELDFGNIPVPSGKYVAFLSKPSGASQDGWIVSERQTLYDESFIDPVMESLKHPGQLSDARYLSSDDRSRAMELMLAESTKKTPDTVDAAEKTNEASICLAIQIKRDAYDSPGHGIIRFTVANVSAAPLAIYTGVGAPWALEISGGGLPAPLRIKPGYDEEMMAGNFDPSLFASFDDFKVILPSLSYTHEAYLTPNEFPDLDRITSAVSIRGFYGNAIAGPSRFSEIPKDKKLPKVWKGFAESETIQAELHVDMQKEHLNKVDSGAEQRLKYKGVEELGIPDNVDMKKLTPKEEPPDVKPAVKPVTPPE